MSALWRILFFFLDVGIGLDIKSEYTILPKEFLLMDNSLLEAIHDTFSLESKDINLYAPLTLAYIGDAVFEIIIRTLIVEEKSGTVKKLHLRSSKLVNAKAQADLLAAIEDSLTEEELSYYKRGRNAKPHSVAKNANLHDYHTATGFEALIGYLYLSGRRARVRRSDCLRRQRAMLAWCPESRIGGTASPCQTSGREYWGYSSVPL